MAALARGGAQNPVVSFLSQQLYAECECQRCLECIVESMSRWLREHYRYVTVDGPDEEVLATPAWCIQQISKNGVFQGDCAIVSTCIASMYKSLGITCRYVAIKAESPLYFSHVYVEAETADGWLTVDLTVPEGTIHKHYGRLIQNV